MAVSGNWFLRLLFLELVVCSVFARNRVDQRNKSNQFSQQELDAVRNLPGQPDVTFRHYAGYVKIRPEEEKALFYWFFEAQEKPSEKPLVLWLNGGPGCSSVAYGAAQELGPFLVRNSTMLTLNKYSWNEAANLLFLEAPVGVGFSYTNKSEDLQNLGDQVTAKDSHAFLLEWFKRFPDFKSHEFFIAGESYAGHYVPQLAEHIYDGNNRARNDSYINLKGFMIGNAAINDMTDLTGFIEYAWSHAIISDRLYHNILDQCDFKKYSQTRECNDSLRSFVQAHADIDLYNIYAPTCIQTVPERPRVKLLVAPRVLTQHDFWHKLPSGYDPCIKNYAEEYFNREDVQRALHANLTKLPYPYSSCSQAIKKWNESPDTVLPTIQKLLKAELRIWIYSGDTDGRVPVTSTRYSINEMKMKVKEEWRAWFDAHQVAGWVETYVGGLTFATVRGAGHQVPQFRPEQSLSLISHFLSGSSLPSSRF